MADNMDIQGSKDNASDVQASKFRREANKKVLGGAEATKFINGRSSDTEGLKQLLFHLSFVLAGAFMVARARKGESWLLLALAEVFLGFIASFYFTGFHEMIHNTAFKARWLNKSLGHCVGFIVFRGANWYWYFHWNHHRFTNDPLRDPELSGSTVDRSDPTLTEGIASKLSAYAVFLSGYPFGFERLPGMVRYAAGGNKDLPEIWVDTEDKRKHVQSEYAAFVLGYATLACMALLRPSTWGANLWYYWILPHMLGAGHLRYYQTAEHRACRLGSYTDTSAWITARTTTTWWVYARLAWNMPYHSEHHAWPNVPFHVLPEVYERIKVLDTRPVSDCNPTGEHGFLYIHWVLLKDMLGLGPAEAEQNPPRELPADGQEKKLA